MTMESPGVVLMNSLKESVPVWEELNDSGVCFTGGGGVVVMRQIWGREWERECLEIWERVLVSHWLVVTCYEGNVALALE